MGIAVFVALSLATTSIILLTQRRARSLAVEDWDTLISRLHPVPYASLEKVALEHLQPNGPQIKLETEEIWTLLGGWDGLEKMEQNVEIMIKLAAYVRVWNFEEAVIVSERIRHDSILLKRALFRIRLHLLFTAYRLHVPFHMQQAASSYYLMTRRLLALYETNQFLLYPRLVEAL
jgi:hypothetical protein